MKAFAAVTLAVCAAVCVFAAVPARSAGPMAKPTPTPTPVAIGYDEISRFVMPPASAPPPGSFQDDYQLALQGTSTTSAAAATPTPAPKHHGLGSLLNAVTNPLQGAAGGEAGPGGAPGMGQGSSMMNMMQYGHVVRYTFYWLKNWEREDDPVAHTAIITKCPQHQIIRLNLSAKTYTVEDTSARGPCVEQTPQPMMGPRGHVNMEPGTVDMTMKSSTQNLGPKTLDGIATTGSTRDFDMTMSNATGSCTNGQFGMTTVVYVSGIRKQRSYCPLALPKYVASSPGEAVSSGGCKPTIHGSMGGGNPMANNSDFLEMYLLTEMHQGASGGRGFKQLLERGNVEWYLKPQAEALFTPPPDFTKVN